MAFSLRPVASRRDYRHFSHHLLRRLPHPRRLGQHAVPDAQRRRVHSRSSPPTLERFFDRISPDKKHKKRYKHTIEPQITYRDITGINNFFQFIRFDADATL